MRVIVLIAGKFHLAAPAGGDTDIYRDVNAYDRHAIVEPSDGDLVRYDYPGQEEVIRDYLEGFGLALGERGPGYTYEIVRRANTAST